MPAESITLRALAQQFKGRLSDCVVFDANVCTSRAVPGRPWELIAVSGEPFFQRLRFTRRGRRFVLFANNLYVHGVLHGTFANGPLTINAKQELIFRLEVAEILAVADERYPVFTQEGRISPDHRDLLGQPRLISLVAQSALKNRESLYFTNDGMGFYLIQTDPDRVCRVIELMIDLARGLEIARGPLNLEALPHQFHPLIPLIRKWGVEDDSDREELLDATSTTVLRSLVEAVSPYLNAIDSYVDSFGGEAPSEQAAALGRLAECAIEAMQRL